MLFILIPALLAVAGMGFGMVRSAMRNARLQETVKAAQTTAAQKHSWLMAQNGLSRNLDMLRSRLAELGPPHLEGKALYFGTHRINGNADIVDHIKAKFGGAATIFMRDERVASNVRAADGSSVIGTRLAPGPAHDTVLGKGLSYRGETQILGVPYLAHYEPIIGKDGVIGILFAGVEKDAVSAAPPQGSIEADIAALANIITAQAEAAQEALTLRQEYEDLRRTHESARLSAAQQQREALTTMASALDELAKGNLSSRITKPMAPEYENLRGDFNTALAKLQKAMSVITANAREVQSGAGEITGASDDLARRTEHQAASLEQTAAALNQITAAINKTAASARQAREIANAAKKDAQTSGDIVQKAVDAMRQIDGSSTKISNIIGVIDEIAFQTNLLALNAGVEAARAGDAGRGFAVVATEVRALAQRSADAAKEIKQVISHSSNDVQNGVKLVEGTGQALTTILAHVEQLDGVVAAISAAVQEQATGLGEVNSALTQMDQITQQNAAMVEQTTAASHGLSDEAEKLDRLVRQFQLA